MKFRQLVAIFLILVAFVVTSWLMSFSVVPQNPGITPPPATRTAKWWTPTPEGTLTPVPTPTFVSTPFPTPVFTVTIVPTPFITETSVPTFPVPTPTAFAPPVEVPPRVITPTPVPTPTLTPMPNSTPTQVQPPKKNTPKPNETPAQTPLLPETGGFKVQDILTWAISLGTLITIIGLAFTFRKGE